MWYWLFMLMCVLILPTIMIITGRLMWKHCPKEINGIYGYRTKRSRQNQVTWKFAHEYFGKLSFKSGIVALILSIIVFIPFMNSSKGTIALAGMIICILQCAVMLISIAITENALKKAFTDEGVRK